MKTAVPAVVAVLSASQFLLSLMTPLALAFPVLPGHDVEPHSSELIPPHSVPVAPVNLRLLPLDLNGIHFSQELQKVFEMRDHVQSGASTPTPEKETFGAFLLTFARDLEVANRLRVDYPRDAIYNTVKEMGSVILRKWRNTKTRYRVVAHLMDCLAQTKPPDGFVEVPLQRDLNDLEMKIASTHGTLMYNSEEWRTLNRFFKSLQDSLRTAGEVSLPFDKLAVDKVVMYSRSAVEKWGEWTGKDEVTDSINRCVTLIWVTPVIFNGLYVSSQTRFSCSGTATPHPSTSTAPPQSYTELRMSGLLNDPKNLINALILPGLMELVPGDVCLRKANEWSLHLSLMDVTLKYSVEAQTQIHISQRKLRDKVLKASRG